MKYLLLIMLFVSASLGATYYVDADASDDTGDGSIGDPWKTLGGLSTQTEITSGDSVLLQRGDTWAEALRDVGNDIDAGVFYGAYGTGAKPAFLRIQTSVGGCTFDNLAITAGGDYYPISLQDGDNYVISNCDIDADNQAARTCINIDGETASSWITGVLIQGNTCINAGAAGDPVDGSGIGIGSWVENVVIRNNTIYDCEDDGIVVYNIDGSGVDLANVPRNVQILNNTVHDCGVVGIDIGIDPVNVTAIGNIVYDNGNTGILIDSGANNILVKNNIISNPGAVQVQGIKVSDASNWEITDNTIYGAETYGIYVKNTNTNGTVRGNIIHGINNDMYMKIRVDTNSIAGTTVDSNCYYDTNVTGAQFGLQAVEYSTLAAWQTASGYDTSSILADPKFIDTTDFHLGSNSPCLGIGRYNEEFPLGRNRYNKFGHRRLP